MSTPGATEHKTLYSSEYEVKINDKKETRLTRWVIDTAVLYDTISKEFGTPKRMWVREGPDMWEIGTEGKTSIK